MKYPLKKQNRFPKVSRGFSRCRRLHRRSFWIRPKFLFRCRMPLHVCSLVGPCHAVLLAYTVEQSGIYVAFTVLTGKSVLFGVIVQCINSCFISSLLSYIVYPLTVTRKSDVCSKHSICSGTCGYFTDIFVKC